jgi:hypothetical protein
MRPIILGLAIVALFANCRNNKSELENTRVVLVQDTSRLYTSSILTDKSAGTETYAATLGSAIGTERPVTSTKPRTSTRKISSTVNNNSSGTVASTPVPAKKKGWSDRAKGTVIGAGTGAAAGAIINKKDRVAGAIIGGIIGAAGGYVIGNERDRKKGRP